MSKHYSPYLLSIIDHIEHNRTSIVDEWVGSKKLIRIFSAYKISLKKFESTYALSIVEYFIATIKEQNNSNTSAAMKQMLHFFLERDITPKDIFDIFRILQGVLIHSIFQISGVKEQALPYIDELNGFFDENLSTLLELYTDAYKKRELQIYELTTHHKKLKQILQIINFVNTKIFLIQNEHIILANRPFLELLGVKNMQELNKKYLNTLEFMHNVDSDAFDLNTVSSWLENMNEHKKAFKADIFHHKYAKTFTYNGRVTVLPDTKPPKYIITLNSIEQLDESEDDTSESDTQTNMKDFYNYAEFEHMLGEMQREAQKSSTHMALIVVDVVELQKINDEQGIEAGDMVLGEVANDIRTYATQSMKIARLEGSRFGIIMPYTSQQKCYEWCYFLSVELNKKPERKTLSLTSVDLSEKINRALMRVYDLADMQSESLTLRTDFENIEIIQTLPYQQKFTKILQQLATLHTSLYYKNISVSSDAEIVHVYDDNILLKLSKAQMAVAKHNSHIFFHISSFGNVKASLKIIDLEKHLVKIDKFTVDKFSPLQRQKIRVDAKENTHIDVISGGPLYKGMVLLDLNEDAIALAMPRRGNLQEGSFVSVAMTLYLQDEVQEFHSNATVYRVEKTKDFYKIVMMFQVDTENFKLLNNYIAMRQMQIIQELKSLY